MSWSPGRHLIVGIQGTQLKSQQRRWLQRIKPAGVILFSRNLRDAGELFALCRDIHGAATPPPRLCIDQEGGVEDRFRALTPGMPSAMALGAVGNDRLSEAAGEITGSLLQSFGITVDFAPVVDLVTTWSDNALGTRSFGSVPADVSRHAGAYLRGLGKQSVRGVLKHFPGLGSSIADPHTTLPVIENKRAAMEEADWVPYRTLKDLADAVMISHGYYPEITTSGIYPASLSRQIVTDLLRESIRFEGAALTDDMEMSAIDQDAFADSVDQAFLAGNDAVLVCHHQDRIEAAYGAVAKLHRESPALAARLERSAERLSAALPVRTAFPPEFDSEGFDALCTRIEAFTWRIARQAVTSLEGRKRSRVPQGTKVQMFLPDLPILGAELKTPDAARTLSEASGFPGLLDVWTFPVNVKPSQGPALAARVSADAVVIVGTWNAHLHAGQLRLLDLLAACSTEVRHIALSCPHDAGSGPLPITAACFGASLPSIAAATRFLLGRAGARGSLPVALSDPPG